MSWATRATCGIARLGCITHRMRLCSVRSVGLFTYPSPWVEKITPYLGSATYCSTNRSDPQMLIAPIQWQKIPLIFGSPHTIIAHLRRYSSLPQSKDTSEIASTKSTSVSEKKSIVDGDQKPSLWQRFKKMYKEYWYVLVPVHLATSTVWFGTFYYMALSGIDVVPFLESMGASETIVRPIRDTGAGYLAVAYALYKLATPVRYTVTLGGTTISINYLKRWGVIKPMPSGEQMREMIRAKGTELKRRRAQAMAKMRFKRGNGGRPPNK